MKSFSFIAASLSMAFSIAALAADVPASNCQIFIEKLQAAPNSHGSQSVQIIVKVPYLGNDESITNVQFYGYKTAQDLGNQSGCHSSPGPMDSSYHFIGSDPFARTQYGEYQFSFPVRSGSVVSECPGYRYSTTGSFMVQTNKATYWLNPNMDSNQKYVFDAKSYDILSAEGHVYSYVVTDRGDETSKYYNPRMCR